MLWVPFESMELYDLLVAFVVDSIHKTTPHRADKLLPHVSDCTANELQRPANSEEMIWL